MTARLSTRMRDRAATVGFLVLLVAFIGLVLVPAYRLASQLSADTAALKLASEQRGQPLAIAKSLLAVRDRLGSRAFVGQAVKDHSRFLSRARQASQASDQTVPRLNIDRSLRRVCCASSRLG